MGNIIALGLTTAFEQGVFSGMEAHLRGRYGERLRVTRETSPRLARAVRRGGLDAALVALPLEAPGPRPPAFAVCRTAAGGSA